MRCLTLADALAARGDACLFICALLTDSLAERVRASGHAVSMIEVASAEAPGAWDMLPLDPGEQDEDARRSLAALGDEALDWLIVDHYRRDARWERQLRGKASRILAIDDLANRPHDCDLLLDHTLGRSPRDYEDLVPPHCRILAGARFAPIRSEFARERPGALRRRREGGEVRRILVSLGTTDVGGVTARVVEAAFGVASNCAFDIVLGAEAPSLAPLRAMAAENPAVGLHVDSRDMAGLMAAADLAIGAAGTSSWERCCLGLPAINLILADNQRYVARMLDEAGAAMAVDGVEQLPGALERLLRDETRRLALVAASAAVTEGGGADLVAGLMRAPGGPEGGDRAVELRPAEAADAERLWLWRNDFATRAASPKDDPVTWPVHVVWYEQALRSPDRHLFIAERAGDPVGMVRFDAVPGAGRAWEVSINIRPEARGGGTGRAVLEAGCGRILAELGPARLEASISRANTASRRIFEAIGFGYAAPLGESGFDRYVRPADPADPVLPAER